MPAAERRRVVALMGPTAAGKTEAAMRVADEAQVGIVSVDSAMVYRRMDIGTAKPDAATMQRYPHALVDIVDPVEAYSAARFVADADAQVRAAFAAGRTPLLVGGTMLYFRAFRDGLAALPPADAELRAAIAARAVRDGWPALHGQLARRDAAAAARIDPNNGARIARALEVLELTGRSIASWWSAPTESVRERLDCELLQFAIVPADRAALHRRIEVRLAAMLRRGLVAEVQALRDDPATSLDLPAMRAVGYRQIWRHLDGAYGLAEATARVAAATRQVAKRQYTWLRRWPGLQGAPEAKSITRAILQKL